MILRSIRRTVAYRALLCALLWQNLHIIHQQVICHDPDGSRIECADLLGRCSCHNHDEYHPAMNLRERTVCDGAVSPSLYSALRRCEDIALSSFWRESRAFQIPFPVTGSSSQSTAAQSIPLSLATLASTPGPSPPKDGRFSTFYFSIWRC